MSILRQQIKTLLLLLFGVMVLNSQSVAAAEADSVLAADIAALAVDIENYETQLADLESQFGPYHRSLMEPLESLIDLAESQADFDRVAELQNRQLQVMRTVQGFKNPELIPLLRDIVVNEIRLQNWEAVSDHLEHIRYLVADNDDDADLSQLEVMEQQAYWHLARVYLDKREFRARNFFMSRRLQQDMLKLAEDKFGEDSPELTPWLYKSAMSEYRLVELLNASDGIASDTIDRLIREEGAARLQTYGRSRIGLGNLFGNNQYIPVVEDGDLIGEAYLRDASRSVHKIGEIVEQQGDREAQAMALIYEGDFFKLMGRGTAIRKYKDAREMLLEAGIDAVKIEQFFNQPAIIPLPELFLRLDDALDHVQKAQAITGYTEDQAHLGQFIAWQEGLADVPLPTSNAEYLGVNFLYNQVEATLSVSSSGSVSSVEVIAAIPDESRVEREAWRALKQIQVRPAMFNGRTKRVRDVHIQYLFLAEQ